MPTLIVTQLLVARPDVPGRLSFVGSVRVALFTLAQFAMQLRRNDSLRVRRRLVGDELERLGQLRAQIECVSDTDTRRALVRDADDALSRAERRAATGLWSSEDIQAPTHRRDDSLHD